MLGPLYYPARAVRSPGFFGKPFSKTFGPDGTLTSATDNGGTINYTYFSDGKVKNITAPGSVVTSMQYADSARNQTQLVDPSAGTINYTYDSFGRVKTQTNARNQVITNTYLPDGRTDNVVNPEGTSTCSYNTNKQLTGISNSTTGANRAYGYDTKGRVTSITETIAGTDFSTNFTYDSFGRLNTQTHPSGIVETFGYNSNGYMETISAGGSTRYTINSMNARQQLTGSTYGSDLTATYGFDTYGYPNSTATGTVQDYRYAFHPVTGNLTSRQNFLRSKSESFTYDTTLDRLLTVTGPQNLAMTYADNGNLSTKSDIGTTAFGYGASAGPYALTGVTSSTAVIPTDPQTATYNSFEKVNTLTEGVYSAALVYNANNQRAKMDVTQSGSTILTRWYAGGSYMKETAAGVTKEYTYLGGDAYTAPVAAVTQDGTTNYYYLLRDYLGNITHQVNTSKTVVAEYSFDAWGRRRNPTNWGYDLTSQPELFADRGFTGHEHLKWFNLVNMNGRLYDPLVGRFLSADVVIQDPTSTQNYNRYSYCLNNPLKYTDPSGYRMAPADEYWNLGAEHFEMRIGTRDALGHSTNTGGADGGDWFSAYSSAVTRGYSGGAAEFNKSYYNQFYSEGYNGTMSFVYYTETRSSDNSKEPAFPGSNNMLVGASLTRTKHEITINAQSGGGEPSYWLAKAGAIAITTSAADGPIPIGEAIGATILTLAAGHDAVVATKNYLNKQGIQYTLRTKTGDIYKIGQTTQYNFTTNTQWRYSQSQLYAWGVTFLPEFAGNRIEILMVEKMKIWNYIHTYDALPPGNKVPW